ncbi:hypothetical protein CISG_04783 [Coccidioides immitis RMSCC 3703]|uniref:Uncharacterized protein n=2 Tax=Coccidioides immitis TaxID=5501 RepID=A0A0J8QRN4_COCIT|nr:hypothetical protein CIRG_09602 [Coccidioides immitis RMSCC 2394]KMU75364.1 hypothetical protein CISG_04783 [Coccidioides immitis RMSCC 3703]
MDSDKRIFRRKRIGTSGSTVYKSSPFLLWSLSQVTWLPSAPGRLKPSVKPPFVQRNVAETPAVPDGFDGRAEGALEAGQCCPTALSQLQQSIPQEPFYYLFYYLMLPSGRTSYRY